MSSLNLVPNPTIMAIQAGLFAANLFAVKKLLLEPYLKVYNQRENQTVGNQAEAKEIAHQNEDAISKIQLALREANEEAAKIRLSSKEKANSERDKLVRNAEVEAKAIVAKIEEELTDVLDQERKKIPQIIEQVSKLVFNQIIRT